MFSAGEDSRPSLPQPGGSGKRRHAAVSKRSDLQPRGITGESIYTTTQSYPGF